MRWLLSKIGNAIMDGLRTLMLTICDGVYRLICLTFNIFEKLGTAQIIEDSQVQAIFNRVGLIIGIFMLFRLTFSFIQYIVDPDAMFDKKKGAGNIIAKIIIAIVLLGSTSTIFKFAFTLQERVVDSHMISKIIFGSNNSQQETEDFGGMLSAKVFTAFYRLNDEAQNNNNDCASYFGPSEEPDLTIMEYNIMKNHGSLDIAYSCITDESDDSEYTVSFDGGGFLALAAGIFVLYTLMIFTIQVGVRVLQLAYLQIIAPIPIMMYITPKGDEQLKKWGQQCLTTFLDFFIRVAIIYFAVFAIKSIWSPGVIGKLLTAGTESASGWETAYVGVIMIIAILTFAKKVPNLIKEIFPSLGGAAAFDYGLNLKKTINDTLAPSVFGAGIGAIGGLASNTIHGVMNTRKAFKENGAKEGFKSIGKTAMSMIGGAAGGAKAGLKTKDITKTSNAVKVANANREKRELMAKAGYHWYNPIPKIEDKVLNLAGETSGAEAKMKTAQFRQDALQQAKILKWQGFSEKNPMADLGLLRSIQEFEEKGEKVYRGIDKNGEERTFTMNSANEFVDKKTGAVTISGAEAKIVNESMKLDKQIKDQGKIIKGLQTADEKAKK